MDKRSRYLNFALSAKDKENAKMRPNRETQHILDKLKILTKVVYDWKSCMDTHKAEATRMFMFYESFEMADKESDVRKGFTYNHVMGLEEKVIKGSLNILEDTYKSQVQNGVIDSEPNLERLLEIRF